MKRAAQIGAWIDKFLAADPPRAKSLVVTIFGDSIAPHGDSIWLQSLIDLLRPFGVNERLVRSSVFRLVEEEWLVAERHGRHSRYAFTPSGRKRFERAHDKIYFASHRRWTREWNGEWTLLIAPPSQLPPASRVLLRRELAWEGFRMISPGTFAHPAGDRRALDEILDRTHLSDHAVVCSARDLDSTGSRSLRSLISQHWELAPVFDAYQKFIERLRPLLGFMPRDNGIASEQAFAIRTLVIHAFRRVLLHDPLLPAELLPEDWPGRKAHDLCRSVYHVTYPDAEQYMLSVLGPAALPRPAPYFQERFGGLPSFPARVPSDTAALLTT